MYLYTKKAGDGCMFFTIFYKLCEERGTSPNAVAKQLGISSGTVTGWKKGVQPRTKRTIQKVADYFGVSVNYMLGYEQKETPDISEDARRKMLKAAEKLAALPDDQFDTAMDVLDAFLKNPKK